MTAEPTIIALGDKGDVVSIDVSLIGSMRGFALMELYQKKRSPTYYSDIILAAAEGYITPHEIDAEWLETNVCFSNAVAACKTIAERSTAKNPESPVPTT